MRVIYMGSPACAIAPLAYLLGRQAENHWQVIAAVSQPARLTGRGRNRAPSDPPLAQYAKEQQLLTLQPEKARDDEFLAQLRELAPDVIVTCAYGQILTDAFLAIPSRATINIHPSRLPAFRGATPVPAALLAHATETAISVLFTVRRLDAGPLIIQKNCLIAPDETAGELTARLFTEAGPLLAEALDCLRDPQFQGLPQDETQVTHCRKIEKDDGLVNWAASSEEIYFRFRALHPWPGTFTFLGERRINIERLTPLPAGVSLLERGEEQPGDVHFVKESACLIVKTGDGYLAVWDLKPEGQRSLSAASFYNGLRERAGLRFLNERL